MAELLSAGIASNVREAAASLSNLTAGPLPSRTNPTGDRRKVLDPRSLVAAEIPAVTDFVIKSLRSLTPGSGRVRDSYNARFAHGFGKGRGTFDFAEAEVASDLPDGEQIVVSVLEHGSRPHIIEARKGPAARDSGGRFTAGSRGYMRINLDPSDVGGGPRGTGGGGRAFIKDEAGGPVLYASRVSHPGTRAHGMFRLTLEASIPVAEAAARRVVSAVAQSFLEAGPKEVKV